MHSLRTSRHLLQLLPQPALPEVSSRGARPLARSASPGASPDTLRPCGLHAASRIGTAGKTLLEVARDPRHLGAEIGFFSVLHTWNQKLGLHPHIHCVVPAGGL